MKTQRRGKRSNPTRGERGIALVVALWVIALLYILGATFLSLSATEHTIASNEANTARAFNIAEAGLERAKARVKNGTEPLDTFLGAPNLYSNVSFDQGTYSVVVEDDFDDANQSTDANNKVFLRSTGKFNNHTVQKELAVLVEVVRGTPPPPIPSPRGSAEVYGAAYEFGADAGGSFDGRDWQAPANISACTDIANCGTLTANPATYGGFRNTTTGGTDLGASGTMYGIGCPPGPCPSQATNTGVPLTTWDSFIDAAKLAADRTLTVNGAWNAGTVTWGTVAAPEITVINNTTSGINWSSVVNGAGVLIIESTPASSGTFFQATGQLNWQGLVIIRSPGIFQFELENATGRIRVFGQVVNIAATRAETEINGSNKNFIKYSSAAMTTVVPQAFGPPPSFTVRNWQERAVQ